MVLSVPRGTDNTITDVTAVIFAENIYQLDGALSVMADSAHSVFGNIPFTGSPLDEYGDVKSAYATGYDYNNVAADGDFYMVNNVNVSKISDSSNKVIPVDLFVGFVDFEIYKYRNPRS